MARRVCGFSTLQIFICPVYSLVDNQKRNKLELKSKKCTFIKFTKRSKGFRFWDPETRSNFTNRDVVFDEESILQERSEMKDKAQCGTLDSSADSQAKKVEFSDGLKKPDASDEDSSYSTGIEQKAT